MMSPHAAVLVFALGGALIAMWLLVRFPSLGPQSLRSSFVAALVSVVIDQPLIALLRVVSETSGAGPAMLLVGLPLLTMLFWASGCLVRAAAHFGR